MRSYARLGAWRRAGSRRGGRRQLTGATRTSRPNERAARTTRPAGKGGGAQPGPPGPPEKPGCHGPYPGGPHGAPGPSGLNMPWWIAVTMVVVPEDYCAGEEDDRQDEKDPGDDHDPRRGRVEPGQLSPRWWRRRRRSRGDGSRLDRGFGRFSHALNIAHAYKRRNTFGQQTCCESRRDSSVPE